MPGSQEFRKTDHESSKASRTNVVVGWILSWVAWGIRGPLGAKSDPKWAGGGEGLWQVCDSRRGPPESSPVLGAHLCGPQECTEGP